MVSNGLSVAVSLQDIFPIGFGATPFQVSRIAARAAHKCRPQTLGQRLQGTGERGQKSMIFRLSMRRHGCHGLTTGTCVGAKSFTLRETDRLWTMLFPWPLRLRRANPSDRPPVHQSAGSCPRNEPVVPPRATPLARSYASLAGA